MQSFDKMPKGPTFETSALCSVLLAPALGRICFRILRREPKKTTYSWGSTCTLMESESICLKSAASSWDKGY